MPLPRLRIPAFIRTPWLKLKNAFDSIEAKNIPYSISSRNKVEKLIDFGNRPSIYNKRQRVIRFIGMFAFFYIFFDNSEQIFEETEFMRWRSIHTTAMQYLLAEDPADINNITAQEHMRQMAERKDNDLLTIVTGAYLTKPFSEEMSHYFLHLAHLKYPDLIGGNSSQQINLDEQSLGEVVRTEIVNQLGL